jgi:hypothetical protein
MSAFRTYWKVYGGIRALLLSPYLWLSGVFWAFLRPIWGGKADGTFPWVEWGLSIVPGMLSFSLGAMAIFLAFANERFLRLLRQGGREDSYLMNVVVAFFHFILVQFFAIASAILVVAYPWVGFSAISFWAFLYALASGIAASAALLDMAEILNLMGTLDSDDDEDEQT